MSLHRFFLEDQVVSDETEAIFPLRFSSDDLDHVRALRLETGEKIAIIDADQDYFIVKIERIDGERIYASICSKQDKAHKPSITLMQGLPKKGKFDVVVRAATELGISRFVPLVCERSVVKLNRDKATSRVTRWRKVAKSAAMQSGQTKIPLVSMPVKLMSDEGAHLFSEFDLVLVFWEEAGEDATLRKALEDHALFRDAKIAIVIGPEGGISKDEIELIMSDNPHVRIVTLGDSILRTETAAIIASALVSYELDQFFLQNRTFLG